MPRGNVHNLRTPTSEEAREIGRKGGLASAESRKARREWKDTLEIILSLTMNDGKPTDLSKLKNLSKERLAKANLTVNDKINISMVNQAMKGNVKAYELIRDQIGEKPSDVQPDGTNSALAIYVQGINARKQDDEDEEEDGHQDSPPS